MNCFSKITNSISEIEIIKNIKEIDDKKKLCYEYLFFVAENHHNISQKNLGDLYLRGEICKANTEKAIQYFLLATKENNIEAEFF